MEINKVGVLGCGLWVGHRSGCATAGFDVTVLEVEQKYLDKGFAGIEKSLAKFARRHNQANPQAVRARLRQNHHARLAACPLLWKP